MIQKLLCLTILLTSGFVYIHAQAPEISDHTNAQSRVVINHAMIERFHQAEFDSNAMTFQDILRSYSMDDVVLLVHSYRSGDLILTDKPGMDEKLAQIKLQMDQDDCPVRMPLPLVTENALKE